MIIKLHRSKKGEGWLWYHNDNLGIRYTFFVSVMSTQTEQTTGIEFVFLVFNLLIAWKRKAANV